MALVNSYIASAMEGVLMQQNTGSRFDFGDILSYCAPLDSLKLLEVNSNPIFLGHKDKRTMLSIGGDFCIDGSVEKVIDSLTSQPNNCKDAHFTLASLVYAKSSQKQNLDRNAIAVKLLQKYKPVKFAGAVDEIVHVKQVNSGTKDVNRITVVSNRSSVVEPVWHVLNRAREMYKSKAYLHWYSKYGVEHE